MNKEIIIRNTKKTDFRVVENLIRDCFFNVYQPGCLEHYVIKNLRESEDYIEELDFVIEKKWTNYWSEYICKGRTNLNRWLPISNPYYGTTLY